MSVRRSFAIIGTGALGGLYGGLLARYGFEVHFLANRDAKHLRDVGLRVESPLGDFQLDQVNVHSDPATLPACDVTIVALKTTQNHLLKEILPVSTRAGGHVLVLQNGLDVGRDSERVIGEGRVLGGCCFLCSNKVGPGHIRHLDYGSIVFGDYASQTKTRSPVSISEKAEAIAEDLQAAGIDAKTTDDLPMTRWKKLMWNIPFNGLSVALDASTKEIVDHPDSVQLAETIIREVHGAAISLGVMVPEAWIQKQIDATKKMVPYDASMRLDFKYGRPMELDAIFANPIKAAESVGYRMPSVSMLLMQLRFLEFMQEEKRLLR